MTQTLLSVRVEVVANGSDAQARVPVPQDAVIEGIVRAPVAQASACVSPMGLAEKRLKGTD